MAEVSRTTGRHAPERGDVTALQESALAEQRDEEKRQAAASAAKAREVQEYDRKHTVIDYSEADTPIPEPERNEDPDEPYREIIAKYKVEQMAYGRIVLSEPEYNEYGELSKAAQLGGIRYLNFEEGRRYRVPKALAEHMDERGLLWH
jgi:hypothetical protein